MKTLQRLLTGGLLLSALCAAAPHTQALVPERREGDGSQEFGWLMLPTPIHVEGIGQAVGVFGILSNVLQSVDVVGGQTLPGGDIEFSFLHIKEIPLFTPHLLVSGTRFRGKAPVPSYARGIDSHKDDFIQTLSLYDGYDYRVNLRLWEERLNLFYQGQDATATTLKVYDNQGTLLSSAETTQSYEGTLYGAFFDFTDDASDPRKGLRFGRKVRPLQSRYDFISDTRTTDTSATAYVPMFGNDTLVLNVFRSTSTITRAGVTDEATARQILDQGCVVGSPTYQECVDSENQRVAEFLAYNRHGMAMPLGGTNRLRAYPMNRFTAGNACFQAVEYRLNFSDKPKKFNYYLLGGVRTLLQMAFFHERGTVNDDVSQLGTRMRTSTGLGLRALISGVVYRLDVARGNEGTAVNLFFDYPLQFNPLLE